MKDDWARHLPAGSTAFELVADGESLATAFSGRWAEDPGAVSIVDLTREGEKRTLTRDEVASHSAGAAALLADRGVAPGDRVLFSGAPSLPYLLLYLGALRLGATIVPANTGYTSSELEHLIADSGATHAVVDQPERVAGVDLPNVVPDLASIEDSAGATPPLDRTTADDLAMIAYTSGTTGRPKGAMLSHGNLLSSARAVTLAWRWGSDDGLVLALPLFHLHGLGVGVHGSFVAGGRVILLPGFSPELVVGAAGRPDATMFFGVPTMHKRLVEHAEADAGAAATLRGLRLVVSGSAPLADDLWRRIAEVTGQEVLERYGMTETVMNISNPYEGERRPGTVGLPLPGVEVRFEGGGGEGEILVRGPNVFRGYFGNPAADGESFTADGWFRTGDIGRRDSDGYVAIIGRSKELIISGGYNVYPREVEEVLELHDDVAEAVVVGTPSEEWGEVVTAFVVARDPQWPPPAAELTALVESRLAAYKKPRAYHFITAVPRNTLGKVERHRLTVPK